MAIPQIDNIIAAWDFTRLAVGDVVLDVSGNGNHLTHSDNLYLLRLGKIARHYDNPVIYVGNGVSVSGNAFRIARTSFSHNLSQVSWSMAGWFSSGSQYQYDGWYGISHWQSWTNIGMIVDVTSQEKPRDKIDFRTWDTSGNTHMLQSSVVNTGVGWYHLGITYNHSTKEKITYFNGNVIAQGTATHNADIRWTGDYITIPGMAGNATNAPYIGGLDTQIITNDVMTQADFDVLYAAGVGIGYQWNEFGSKIQINAGVGTGYGTKIQINNTDASTGIGKDIEVI